MTCPWPEAWSVRSVLLLLLLATLPTAAVAEGDPGRRETRHEAAAQPVAQVSDVVSMDTGRLEGDEASQKEPAHARIAGPDHFMLVGYFVLMLGIGVYFYRRMQGMKDFFSGGNNIPWWLSGVSFYMSSFSAFGFVAFSALAYRYGWAPVTIFWVTVPATVFSVTLFARRWRRARIDSPVEYLETRYNAVFRQLVAWQGLPVKLVDDALKLVAIGTFIKVSMNLPMQESMILSGLIILAYTFMGGLWAVAITDFVQFIVMVVAMVILLPLAIHRLHAVDHWTRILPQGLSDFFTAEYNVVYLVLLVALYSVAWSSVNWALIQRYYCVADEREAIKTGWFVTLLNVLGPPLMLLPAIAGRHFLVDIPLEMDKEVYPRLCMELLPAGVLGLVIAAMFAATMSTLSGDYNVCAGVLTNDVYRRLCRRSASEKELVTVGRLMTLLVGGVALGLALLMSSLNGEDLFKTMVKLFAIVTAPVGVPMLLGLLSRRVTTLAAFWGWLLGILVGLGLFVWCPKNLVLRWGAAAGDELSSLILEKEVVIFAATLLVSLLVTVVLTHLVPMAAEEKQRVAAFHRRLATPIGELDEDRTEGSTAFSPFGIVGVCVLCIGLMLLGILPWVGGWGLTFGLTLGSGVVLLAIGVLMIAMSRAAVQRE